MNSNADKSGAQSPVQIGDIAPNFRARTTMGDMSLSDYRGQWVLLFSHPADFTPVCTSEFVALSRAGERFRALNCALVAISVDSLYSHLGWIRAIHEHFGVTVGFPVVYFLIFSGLYPTLRATFFIDPDGIVRARLCYPATIGRSVEEMLRGVAALQRVDSDNVVTPEGWRPGDDVLLPPYQDQDSALDAAGDACWFHRTRPDKRKKAGK